MQSVSILKENYNAINTSIDNDIIDGEQVIRVVKCHKIEIPDENTYAKVVDSSFHNGIIEVKMLSRLLPDAPQHARGFIGITFRINENDSEFESFYVRPTNGRNCEDPIRRSHGCQYFSYPGYTFSYFREFGIDDFESEVNIDLNEWITLRAEIEDEKGQFYINDMEKPVLVVDNMKHGKGHRGAIGLFVDIGTEGFFKDLKIIYKD